MGFLKMQRSKLNIVTTLASQLAATACGIVTPHVLLTAFGSEAYGITVSITQFLSYITLLESGIGGVARAKLYGPLAKGDSAGVSSVYYAVKRFFQYVGMVFLLYCVILGFGYHDLASVTLFSRPYIFALVLIIGISTLAKYMFGLANLTLIAADQRQYVNNFINVIITVSNTLLIVLLVSLKSDLIWVKLGSSLIFVVRPVLYVLYVRKHYTLRDTGQRAQLEQKWTGLGQHIAYFLHTNTDVVLLTLFADVRLVAVYSIYSLVISSVRALTESFSGGMEARFGELIAKEQTEKLRASFARYSRLLTSVSVLLFSCTGVLILSFVGLYTRGVTDADYRQPLFSVILLLAEAINCFMLPCSSLPVAANRFKQTRWGAYGEAMINIGLSCILIFWNPLLGVAIGTLAATAFRGIYYMAYSAKHILKLSFWKLFIRFAGAVLVICGCVLAGRVLLDLVLIQSYWQWALYGCLTFAVIALPIGALYRRQEKKGER